MDNRETELSDGMDESSEDELMGEEADQGYEEIPEFDFYNIEPTDDVSIIIQGIQEKYGFTVTSDYAADLIKFVLDMLGEDTDATSV